MEITDAVIIPLILGIVEITKSFGLPAKYASILSVLLGVVLILLAEDISRASILQGILYGLSASGLYSGSKSLLISKTPSH